MKSAALNLLTPFPPPRHSEKSFFITSLHPRPFPVPTDSIASPHHLPYANDLSGASFTVQHSTDVIQCLSTFHPPPNDCNSSARQHSSLSSSSFSSSLLNAAHLTLHAEPPQHLKMQPQSQSPAPQQTSEVMELPRVPEPIQSKQPDAHQPMSTSIHLSSPLLWIAPQPLTNHLVDPQRPHDEPEMQLRGGQEGRGPCPGRFCFIIPCPIPCNCCIIPCPC